MTGLTMTIDTYLAAWNDPDRTRPTLIERAWACEGRLVDPPLAAEGHDEINEMVSALHAQFPGHRFRRASGISGFFGALPLPEGP